MRFKIRRDPKRKEKKEKEKKKLSWTTYFSSSYSVITPLHFQDDF
jgi:hypothetical protein